MAVPNSELNRYRTTMGGGLSIKFMTVGLVASTVWFAYALHERGRLPWQHGIGAEIMRKRVRDP
jgi:hypothetical protein